MFRPMRHFRDVPPHVGFGPPWAGPFGGFGRRWPGSRPGPWFFQQWPGGGPGPQGPFGRPFGGPGRGPFGGPGGPGGRRFGRGDLKYVILDLLKDQPRHGYDIIRALEDRFHGFYSPSPGSIYPTLQLLEDQGYVSGREQEGKRVYTITDAGRAFLTERAEAAAGARERASAGWGGYISPELQQLMQEVRGIGQVLVHQGARGALGNPEKVRRLQAVVARARHEIEALFRDGGTSGGVSV
jgi:DNA-binding PadR family transcriptional regulator